jgi:hypothetical protein
MSIVSQCVISITIALVPGQNHLKVTHHPVRRVTPRRFPGGFAVTRLR